ncbi:MAG: hypothetical protein IPP16_10985 [Acidimicrobiaceae bacterium]|nr:hypothetical protein [Acidimicrobiaceae bacterium]
MGIEVVEEDCDLTLTVDVTADRNAATYAQYGVCYTGFSAEGSVVVQVANGGRRTWPIDVDSAPDDFVDESGCYEPDVPVPGLTWRATAALALLSSFESALGVLAYVGLDAGHDENLSDGFDAYPYFLVQSASEQSVQILAAALHHLDPVLREAAARFITDLLDSSRDTRDRTEQRPDLYGWLLWLTPHLIWLGAADEFGRGLEAGPGYEARRALESLLWGSLGPPDGFETTSPAAWWAHWERYL